MSYANHRSLQKAPLTHKPNVEGITVGSVLAFVLLAAAVISVLLMVRGIYRRYKTTENTACVHDHNSLRHCICHSLYCRRQRQPCPQPADPVVPQQPPSDYASSGTGESAASEDFQSGLGSSASVLLGTQEHSGEDSDQVVIEPQPQQHTLSPSAMMGTVHVPMHLRAKRSSNAGPVDRLRSQKKQSYETFPQETHL